MPYRFTQRIHGRDPDNGVELARAELERIEIELTNSLRWEDDGGKIIETAKAVSKSDSELMGLEQ